MAANRPDISLQDLSVILASVAKSEGRSKYITVQRALKSLNALLGSTSRIRKAPDCRGRFPVEVHENQGLPPRVNCFLASIRQLRRQQAAIAEGHHEFNHVLVSDEASMEFDRSLGQTPGYISPFKRMIKLVRSQGLGFIGGVQQLNDIDESIKSNAATVIALRCDGIANAKEAQRLLNLPDEKIHDLMSLPVGEAFVRSDGFLRPVRIRIPNAGWEHRPNNSEIAQRMAPVFAALAKDTILAPERSEEVQALDSQDILGERTNDEPSLSPAEEDTPPPRPRRLFVDHFALLQDIAKAPDASVTEHYRNLSWSGGRGNRIRQDLLREGLIRSERRKGNSGRPKEILVLTDKGRSLINE